MMNLTLILPSPVIAHQKSPLGSYPDLVNLVTKLSIVSTASLCVGYGGGPALRSIALSSVSRGSSTTWNAVLIIEANPGPLLLHRQCATPLPGTLSFLRRDRRAVDQGR